MNGVDDAWMEALIEGWWQGDGVQPKPPMRAWLRSLHATVEDIGADRIVEIGVRAGYSAYAMLSAAPDAWYLGIDNDSGDHGGAVGAVDHARELLAPFPNAAVLTVDSHDVDRLPDGIDLLHVDGDHTTEGCMKDMDLGLRSGVSWTLVDDVDLIPEVEQAVEQWTERTGLEATYVDNGHHGAALIDLRGRDG